MKKESAVFPILIGLIVCLLTENTHSQVTKWVRPGGGFWDVGTNWSTGFAPGPGDIGDFSISDTYDVDWDSITGNQDAGRLEFHEGSVTIVNNDDTQYRLNLLSQGPNLFDSLSLLGGSATVRGLEVETTGNTRIENGGSLTLSADVPAGTTLLTNSIAVGRFDSGTLLVENGASLDSGQMTLASFQNTIGTTTVTGDDSFLGSSGEIVVGREGNGALFANNGAVVSAIGRIFVGRFDGSTGFTVFDDSSALLMGGLDIGHESTGAMQIQNGGAVQVFETVVLGRNEGGEGTLNVKGFGSEMTILPSEGLQASLQIGGEGTGSVAVTDLGRIEANEIVIDDGSLLAAGTGTSVVSNRLDIRNGTLNIQDDANVQLPQSTGVATVKFGSTLEMGGSITPNITAQTIVNDGIMDLSGDIGADVTAHVINNLSLQTHGGETFIFGGLSHDGVEVFNGPGASTRVFEKVSGSGRYTGPGTIHFDSVVRPGSGTGIGTVQKVEVEGNLVLNASSVTQLELAGPMFSQYDWFAVNGDVEIGGQLSVTALNGYQPDVGFVFPIISVNGERTGQFAGLDEGDVVAKIGDVDLRITYDFIGTGSVGLRAVDSQILIGDVNLDGMVNLLDVAPFVELVANSVFQTEADANHDGFVNLLDVAPFINILSN